MTFGNTQFNIALIGWGTIARAVARLLAERGSPARIVAIGVRDASVLRHDLPAGAELCDDPEALPARGAGLVVEAAGRESVLPWGRPALAAGLDFAVSSTSAFADPAVLREMVETARQNGGQLFIPPGALGGVDALAAASRAGLDRVEHRIAKPPRAWLGTEAERLLALDSLGQAECFFSGPAAEAAERFPQNANVAIISALAGLGMEDTKISLIADPALTANRHEISASGAFGDMTIRLTNAPLPENPKSSAMTAYNLVRLIENRMAPLVI